jgi:hypothetical protein
VSCEIPLSPRRHGAVAPWWVYRCVSLFLCSLLFASSLLPRPVQLALLRRSLRLRLRHQSPAPPTSSGSRRYFVRSWQATARPPVSGSAISSSTTPIASNVIALSADPFGSQSPPLGSLGRAFVFAYGSRRPSFRPRPISEQHHASHEAPRSLTQCSRWVDVAGPLRYGYSEAIAIFCG